MSPTVEVLLLRGGVALLDADFASLVAGRKWVMAVTRGKPYHVRSYTATSFVNLWKLLYPDAKRIVYLSGPHDLRRESVRLVENNGAFHQRQRHPAEKKTSQFHGVAFDRSRNKWVASTAFVQAVRRRGSGRDLLRRKGPRTFRRHRESEFPIMKSSTRFHGIFWSDTTKSWEIRVQVGITIVFCGRCCDEEDAARRYDSHAKRLLGSRARLNFPTTQS